MEHSYAVKLLDIYIANAWRIFDANFGNNRAESAIFAVVDLLHERADLKEEFLRLAKATLSEQEGFWTARAPVPLELLEVAVHELQWQEFHQIIETRRRLFPFDTKYKRLVDAFNPAWEDREYYQRYRLEP
ncbi:hypothetical protein ASG50_19170 [Rhizobium sp. Leaf386]|nr:hypothetical protein ASG50_19170 [Rhizobium sp. Leaf386]